MVKKIIVSGPVIVEKGEVLLIRDCKDDFYKFPGGAVEEGEGLEEACCREAEEEISGKIKILKKLSTIVLDKNPRTGEAMRIELHHYLADVVNKGELELTFPVREIKWFPIDEIKNGKYNVAPNVSCLIEKGEIR